MARVEGKTISSKFPDVADRLESLAHVLREHPEDVEESLARIRGESGRDPLFAAPSERPSLVSQAAARAGLTTSDLLLLHRILFLEKQGE
jgi:hypothetical protein